MQPEVIPHSAETDAIWTMDLFLDIYINIKTQNLMSMMNDDNSNHIMHFKQLYQ